MASPDDRATAAGNEDSCVAEHPVDMRNRRKEAQAKLRVVGNFLGDRTNGLPNRRHDCARRHHGWIVVGL